MKQNLYLKSILISTSMLFLFGILTASSASAKGNKKAKSNQACRSLVTGAYLSQIHDSSGEFASRSIINFHENGTVAIIDSAQGPLNFSALSGTYECINKTNVRALVLNFGFNGEENIARTEWTLVINKRSRTLEGEVTLMVFDGLEDVDPFGKEGVTIEFFTFTASPIPGHLP